ncbi:MAG: gamma-glutamyl-gamma-aminobutyrate hydrolase family protein [Holosporaceae bacterium]|jgi:putative glutamine amidotransferase|nr:gamma-glutamyl-gamma-aminobutyrate hydrolase family protein [Holosporaceae bacterium]
MKKIGISQQLSFDGHNALMEIIDSSWGRLLNELQVIPLYLPIYYDFQTLQIDGVILTGGGDLHAISQKKEDKIRDEFEISLIKFGVAKSIPIFGVCRGMQMINNYFGGNLKKVEGHAGCRHLLSNGVEVNSYHDYAIDKLGDGLEIIDICNDVVESVRHLRHKIFAQMSHPEREKPFLPRDTDFLRAFFDA